ncbi:MAG: sigma-54 interaction domain-containing protein [Solirubrobacterales bacterium]
MSNCGERLSTDDIQRVINSFSDGILLTDAFGNVLLHNPAYIQQTLMPFENLVGMNMREIIAARGRTTAAALRVLEEKTTVSMTHSNEDGTIVVTANPIFDVEGNVTMVITYVREVTDLVRLHEELEHAKQLESFYYQLYQTQYIPDPSEPIAVSDRMKNAMGMARQLAAAGAVVLLTGESGVGKDVLARYIHENSSRKNAPFIAVNCGAVPANLLESELFGYAGGAFTGAAKGGKAGLFEAAKGGTLFLDEIGDTSPSLQVALLRVLENKEVTRIGSVEPIPVDVRIIAATNRNLTDLIAQEKFRFDLFYRLNVLHIHIPPLRERRADIIPLGVAFLNMFNQQYKQNKQLGREVARMLIKYDWPGNVRELKNTIERSVVMTKGDQLSLSSLPAAMLEEEKQQPSVIVSGVMRLNQAVEEAERQVLMNAYRTYGSSRKVAQAIGVDHSTVVRKMQKYKISAEF